jgi:surface protein
MGVHAAAPPPMHTCVRLRAPTMRPSPSRARVGTSAGIYSQRTRLVQYICTSMQVRVCRWVRVCILAYACDRVRVLTMREYAACARVRRALFVRPSMEHAHAQRMYTQCMHVSVCMRVWLHRRADRRCGPAAHTRARAASVCARMCDWVRTYPRRHMRAPSVGVDRGWFGSQAFYSASAFNANVGAWNTASVSDMSGVCAASPARRRAPRATLSLHKAFDVALTYLVFIYMVLCIYL